MSQESPSWDRDIQIRLIRQLFDALTDPACILEIKAAGNPVMIEANPAFFRFMGVEETNEIPGQSVFEWLDLSDKISFGALRKGASDLPGERELLTFECVLPRRDHGSFLAELQITQCVMSGRCFLTVMVRDMTTIKQAEMFQELWHGVDRYLVSEANIEGLLEFVTQKIAGTFPFPKVFFTTPKMETLLGGTSDLPDFSVLPSERIYQASIPVSQYRGIEKGKSATISLVFRDPWDLTPSLVSGLDGLFMKIEKVTGPCSELVSKVHKDAFFEMAPDGICLLELETLNIIGTNPAFCRLMGFPDQSFLMGSSILDWWEIPESIGRKILQNVIDAGDSPFLFEQRHVRMDGSHFLGSISGSGISNGEGMVLMLYVRDITVEHEAEILNRISVEIDQKILKGSPIQDLLAFIVRRISLEFSFQIVFFTIPKPDGEIIYIGIDPDFPKYSPVLEGISLMTRWDSGPGSESSFGMAIRTGLPQFVTGEEFEPFLLNKIYLAFGIASVFSVPVTRHDDLLPWGALTIADHNMNDLSERLRTRLIELSERIRIAFIHHEEMDLVRVLKLAMESSGNMEAIVLRDGTIEWSNDSFVKTISCSDEVLSDLDLSQMFPEPAVKGRKIPLKEAIALSEPFKGEFFGSTRSGHPLLVETMVVPLMDRFGDANRVLIQQKNITQEKEIEGIDRLMNQLDEMILLGTPFPMLTDLVATKAREIFHAEAVSIVFSGSDGNVNSKAQSAFSPIFEEELNRWTGSTNFTATDSSRNPESLIAGDSPLSGWMNRYQIQEFRRFPLKEQDQSRGYIDFFFKTPRVLARPSLDRIGNLCRRFSIVLDRYQQEERRRLHETAMSMVANGILITGADRRIQWVNDAFLQMTGYQRDELLGEIPYILRADPQGKRPQEGFWSTILSGETFEGFLEDQKKDGSNYMIEATVTPICVNEEIKNFVVIQKDQTQRILQEREAWRLAHTDQLTGLLNRQAFMEKISIEVSYCQMSGESLALLFLDFDGFKSINDTWGHDAGDLYLKTSGERILSNIRSSDVVARLGGDEFVVLLKSTPEQKALNNFLDSFVQLLAVPVPDEGRTLKASVSIGVAFFPKDAGSPDELIRKADTAMYRSKNMGKNRWCFYTEDP
jgi:diguanylate cyclase (GGDEF)-like protein/PAS domain S-box-containing protein